MTKAVTYSVSKTDAIMVFRYYLFFVINLLALLLVIVIVSTVTFR